MSEVLEKPLVDIITPLHDRIIVKRAVEEEKSKGGIVIPDTAKEKPIRGVVVAVGPGKRLESGEIQPLSVKLGNEILFGKYAGTEVKLENQDYIVMREDDVMAIMKK